MKFGARRPSPARSLLVVITLLGIIPRLEAGVVLNEFMAAAGLRHVERTETGAPRLGSGVHWTDSAFDDRSWTNAPLPAGYGFTGLATDLTSRMKNKAYSLYLRRSFQVSPEQADLGLALVLKIQINDGFVAYLNGREIARANCGPTNHLMCASQPAYNVMTSTNSVDYTIGLASDWLQPGTNILSVQAHNAEQPSTSANPDQILYHVPTPEFRVSAALRLSDQINPANDLELVGTGAAAGTWRMFVGISEPSGGVVDPGPLTSSFRPPSGAEEDFEDSTSFSDWIELFNPGVSSISLAGWSMTDDPAIPSKWHFPANAIIPALGYLLVLCDQRDEANAPAGPAKMLHTNFKLNDGGEYIGLFDASGHFIDGMSGGFPPQVSFCSYGRNPANPAEFGFLATATPGTENAGDFFPSRVDPPEFRDTTGAPLPGGLYTQSVSLQLSAPVEGTQIKFTLNGAEPTAITGFVYTNPIPLVQVNDKTGIVVRARCFLPGLLPSEVRTHTYIMRQPTSLSRAPALLFSGDPGLAFYRPDGAMAIVGGTYDSANHWQPTGPMSYNNAIHSGLPVERECHAEFFYPPGWYPTNQGFLRTGAGIRVSASPWQRQQLRLGRLTTSSPWPYADVNEKPSLNLYFDSEYGSGNLRYPFFTNYDAGPIKYLRLRAGKNDNTNPFITDELVRRLWIDMGHVGSRGLFCSLYVNAVYRGVYNLCERIREPFFQSHYRSSLGWDVNYIYSWVDGDGTAYSQLLSTLDRDLNQAANWKAVTDRLDVDNAADYYLLNIYNATWDWPENNFTFYRERSTGPESKFRFAVWDAEGAFNAIAYNAKTVSYNTITSDLLVPSGSPLYGADLTRIFRRLCTSKEFKLRFADRVNLHCFNGGVLDDRDPDGGGPLKSNIKSRLDELVAEAGSLVMYNSSRTLSTSWYSTWTSPTLGRRAYLLGTVGGRRMLRDSGLWPATEPPVFDQPGGEVPSGFGLGMTSSVSVTNQTATILFTLNGEDPRLLGGGTNASASAYTQPMILNGLVQVKARAVNDTTGEWSPLAEATFVVAPERASAANLAIAELMYHPPGPTTAEAAAGFTNPDQFEFIRLQNIGSGPINLGGVSFSAGIDFKFAEPTYLSQGQSILIVKDLTAFRVRYGRSLDDRIAGEFTGNFSNGGERIVLLDAQGQSLRDFTYFDTSPWPSAADGDGPSLLLKDPWLNPDHADPMNWTVSATPGGVPGGSPLWLSYQAWRELWWGPTLALNDWVSGPASDPEGDGLSNYAEYVLGLDPHRPSDVPTASANVLLHNGALHLVVSLELSGGASEGRLTWEVSSDLSSWAPPTSSFTVFGVQPGWDGRTTMTFVDPEPLDARSARFVRPSITGP